MIFAILGILWGVWPKRGPENPTFKNDIPLFGKVLIGIWLLSSVFLWIAGNWDIHRSFFVDEGSFWANAGQQMVQNGVIEAQQAIYKGGGQHPFGVPFMASAPMACIGYKDPWAVYCWPLVIIFSLGLWLLSQRWGKWALLFFMSALIAVFSNAFWGAQLMYELVYGESICVILLLVILSEIWTCLRKSVLAPATILALSGAIGLLALTKAPVDILPIPLELILLFLLFRYHRPMITAPVVLGCVAVSLFPGFIWSIFVQYYHIRILNSPMHLWDMPGRILHPNMVLLSEALKGMWGLNQNMLYTACLSILILGLTAFPIRSLIVPVLLWIAAWFFYYAYVYNYPSGKGDYLSSFRYFMPIVLVLYWAAACAYQETIDYFLTKNASIALLLQCLSAVFLVMILFFRTCVAI